MRRIVRQAISIVVFFTMGCVFGPSARAALLDFPDFTSTEGLSINATAEVVSDNGMDPGPVLKLAQTQDESETVRFRSGSVFTTDKVFINEFSTHFTFRMRPNNDSVIGTDGLVFVIQGWGATPVGLTGGNLGFSGLPNEEGSSNVGVEFDVWNNGEDNNNDTSDNHVGLDINNVSSIVTADVATPFEDGNLWHVWIDYDGDTIQVRVDQSETRPGAAQLSHQIDLEAMIGDTHAHIGFTAATGGDATTHEITSWSYQIPEPATALLIGIGMLGSAIRRR